jgi:hypothetical protein
MVTNAHRVEVKVSANGHANAPPSGTAAAAPPAGAHSVVLDKKIPATYFCKSGCMALG